MFKKLCLIGVGLIGGSVARAARKNKLARQIVAFGRLEDKVNLEQAKQLNVVDEFYFDMETALKDADCVVIAIPVGAFEDILKQMKPFWQAQTVYTDVGSTKTSVIEAAKQVFGLLPDNFIPAHPIAGAENSGVQASMDDLFLNKRLIITPEQESSPSALKTVQSFWQSLGSIVSIMDAAHHDTVLAATSHLPHILAFALVDLLGRKDEQVDIFKYAAGGFNDFTRIASSDPTMWLDICLANKQAILPLIQQLKGELGTIEHLLEDENSQQLFETFTYAKNARQRFLDQLEK